MALGALMSPRQASATVAPLVSVAPTSGPVGSVVTVKFSAPSGDGCGGVQFESSAAPAGGFLVPWAAVPSAAGTSSGARFVVPSVLGDPPQTHDVPVTAGGYFFPATSSRRS